MITYYVTKFVEDMMIKLVNTVKSMCLTNDYDM